MTDRQKFEYHMMDTVKLAQCCQNRKNHLYNLKVTKKWLKNFGTKPERDENARLIRLIEKEIAEIENVLQSRQMKMFDN